MKHPSLIVMSGLPGSGKSSIAEGISKNLKIPIFSVDPIESAMIQAGIAKGSETDLAAYLVAETLADEQLKLGHSVIIDAVNAEEEAKEMWRKLARKHSLSLTIIDVSNGDSALHKKRLEKRVRNLHGFKEVTWGDVVDRKKKQTDWKEPALKLDSASKLEPNITKAVNYIKNQN